MSWDDGKHAKVKSVKLTFEDVIMSIQVEYHGTTLQSQRRGTTVGPKSDGFTLSPDEYITEMLGYYKPIFSGDVITMLKFKTNKRTYGPYGNKTQYSFSLLAPNGNQIAGFSGTSGTALNSIDVHFAPIPPPGSIEPEPVGSGTKPRGDSFKLPAKGGNQGVSWDDGAHDNVRKVYVGQGDSCLTFVKFEYNKGSELLIADGHGKKSLLVTKEFVVDPDDYITSVKVYYDKLTNFETEVITSLIFKSFKGITSQPFGVASKNMFTILEGGKITGFHGNSSDVLHSIGVYMSLSSTPMLRGKWIQVEQKDKGPGERCSHAIAMVGDKLYSFGGELKPDFHIDRHLYVFNFKTHTWSLAPPNGDVPELPCIGVCMVSIGTTLYVFGGRDGYRNYNGFFSYDTVKSEWKLITHVSEGPAPRSFHAMAADDKNVYVFGGVSTTRARLNTLHAYSIIDQKWAELPNPGESCKARGGAGLVVVEGKIWVVYGFSGDEMDDVHCFDLIKSKWIKVETKGEKPWPRSVFAIAVVGKYIVISGGEIDMDPKAHLGPGKLTSGVFVLDTESLFWEKLEEGHTPRGWCASTSASIDGKRGLLMYGGKAETNSRYDGMLFYGVGIA